MSSFCQYRQKWGERVPTGRHTQTPKVGCGSRSAAGDLTDSVLCFIHSCWPSPDSIRAQNDQIWVCFNGTPLKTRAPHVGLRQITDWGKGQRVALFRGLSVF